MEEKQRIYFAHKLEDGTGQTVKEHLEGTAELAERFAGAFEAGEAGRIAGLLHDVGKYSDNFQRRIRGSSEQVDHSTAGAQLAAGKELLPVAFAVAGHHAGIPDGGSRLDTAGEATLTGRLKKQLPDYSAWETEIRLPSATLPAWFQQEDRFGQSFFTRMLFSCLVDADYLNTEAFMQGEQPRGNYESLPALLHKLQNKTDAWLQAEPVSELNSRRNDILRACIIRGRSSPRGLYTLTVPTGGGKTIASLSFALEQAAALQMDRVIYVIPYTSIIDQTVSEFQKILGGENVLGHYAEADFQMDERENLSPENYRKALAAENWDAPIIVTTAVQFFESLFSNRSAKCRKLHNIAGSVVIFDEAQTLPQPFLRPCVAAIAQLVRHYGVTAVLCTATQPELQPLLQEYHLTAQEIYPDGEMLCRTLRRTTLQDAGELSQEDLTARLAAQEQVLCVVNRRKTAQDLYQKLPEAGRYCLTTLLCPADRKTKLQEIRDRLQAGLPCRVVSTSLIEAGVDVDFPAAFREEAGLDSLIQTAGRCNREGREKDPAKRPVYMFRLEDTRIISRLKQSTAAMRAAQRKCPELDQPDAVQQYFQILFYKVKGREAQDEKKILDAFRRGRDGVLFPFSAVSEDFQLIQSPTKTVYIMEGDGKELCGQLLDGCRSRSLFRRLSAYAVSVYQDQFDALYRLGSLVPVDTGAAVLTDSDRYSPEIGLQAENAAGKAFFDD